MKISVITVCYNAVDTLEQTMLSVLNQTYPDVEYIIIDGGSTDGTVDVIKKYADRIAYWVSEPDKGIYDAMNKGIKVATGEWINFMNAGDYFNNNKVLEVFVPQIWDADIAYGDSINMLSSCCYYAKPFPLKGLSHQMMMCHQATFVKTSIYKKHLFDTSFRSSGDYNFFYNAYFNYQYRFQYIPIIVANYDESAGMSKDNYLIVQRENLVIHGIIESRKSQVRLLLITYLYYVKRFVRLFIPQSILKKREINNRVRLGYTIVEYK